MSGAVLDDGLGDIQMAAGPWDVAQATAPVIDFGPLKLPAIATLQAELEIDSASKRIGAVSVRVADCMVQFKVVAAPGTGGFWSDLRRALIANIRQQRGHHTVVEGAFGPEVIATLMGRRSDGSVGEGTARFVGVEGSRWVLRATVTGDSAARDVTVARVNALISQCVVDRGRDAAAAGTVLELSPPPGMAPEEP